MQFISSELQMFTLSSIPTGQILWKLQLTRPHRLYNKSPGSMLHATSLVVARITWFTTMFGPL